TGTISSLQRQLEIQESQLRRIKSEKEMLQRKLREQEKELETTCAKFRSLREEQEHEVMMATMEENISLQQVVTELKSMVAEQKEQMNELQGVVSQLRAELQSCQRHSHTQQREHAVLQSQAEMLQHKVLQATVARESISSRFERYRNKIIQATFSTAGSKPPQAELTDEEVLEAMQVPASSKVCFQQPARDWWGK
ncbi:CCD27 protein, partial [Geococcyx californianus]|nr:CCD27 protein [Geococcyx californianus]